MPGRIQVHPHIVLRLKLRQRRPGLHRLGPGHIQIVNLDVQVHGYLRIPRPRQLRLVGLVGLVGLVSSTAAR